MFSALGVDINYTLDHPYAFEVYVPGHDLLTWAQQEVLALGGAKPAGSGSQSDPYQIEGLANFVWAWKNAPASQFNWAYYRIAGRLIVKIPKNCRIAGYDTSDGYYMADVALSGLTGAPEGTIWNRKGGASYREFGKFIHAGGVKEAVAGVDWSQRMASAMRMLMKGTTRTLVGGTKLAVNPLKISSQWTQGTGGNWTKTAEAHTAGKDDTQAALPLLAAVMFIAEPARNPRAWVMGLMLLDLMGEEYSPQALGRNAMQFTFERALVSPKRLDVPSLNYNNETPPASWVNAQTRDNKLKQKMKQDGSAAAEGVYPASPKWSSRTKSVIDIRNDYIQQKEVSLVSRWLELTFNMYFRGSKISARALQMNEITRSFLLYSMTPPRSVTGIDNWGVGADLTRIIRTELIGRRAGSLKTLGTLLA